MDDTIIYGYLTSNLPSSWQYLRKLRPLAARLCRFPPKGRKNRRDARKVLTYPNNALRLYGGLPFFLCHLIIFITSDIK